MDGTILPSIISALSGLGGVWLGGWITNRREAQKEVAQRAQATTYLAILVIAHLDQLADQCFSVAYDDGTSEGRPAGKDQQYHMATVPAPSFNPLALSVDWRTLPTDLMYGVLNFPEQQAQVDRYLEDIGEYDDPPEYFDYFRSRQLEYARLAVKAADLSARLRRHANLPAYQSEIGGVNRDARLAERLTNLERLNAERKAAWSPMPFELGIPKPPEGTPGAPT